VRDWQNSPLHEMTTKISCWLADNLESDVMPVRTKLNLVF
jgi:hypothetical protein